MPVRGPDTFRETVSMMEREGIPLVGAVQDITGPKTMNSYMLFPIAVNDSKERLLREELKDDLDGSLARPEGI